jgi:hypothetical protein
MKQEGGETQNKMKKLNNQGGEMKHEGGSIKPRTTRTTRTEEQQRNPGKQTFSREPFVKFVRFVVNLLPLETNFPVPENNILCLDKNFPLPKNDIPAAEKNFLCLENNIPIVETNFPLEEKSYRGVFDLFAVNLPGE